MRKQTLALVGVLAMSIVAATGCASFAPEKTSSPSDPSQGTNQNQSQENVMPTTVYVADQNGFVVPMQIQVGQSNEVAKTVLSNMVQGSAGDAALAGTGLHNILPKGTKINGISLGKGLATVNFSKEVIGYKTEQEEQNIVDSTVWALTGFNDIKKVQIEVDGHIMPTLKFGTPIGNPISRDHGINVQLSSDVNNPSEATKLTLYFEGAAKDGSISYLVPVTRIIPKAKETDLAQLTMQELAKGPGAEGLAPVMNPTLKPLNTSVKDKVATLNFGSDFQATDGTDQEKAMINSIALSLSANAGVDQVKFTVNGKTPAAAQGMNLSKPVSVPKIINSEKL